MHNIVTSLAIISGNILRDVYFSKELSFNTSQQYKNELDKWMANLPKQFRQSIDSGRVIDLPKDQAEAIVGSQHEQYLTCSC